MASQNLSKHVRNGYEDKEKKIIKNLLFYIGISLTVISCSKDKLSDQIIGQWKIDEVIVRGEVDNREGHKGKWILFKETEKFESGNFLREDPNTCNWEIDETASILSINSNAGDWDDSEWKINILGNEMRWRGIATHNTTHVEIVNSRVEN